MQFQIDKPFVIIVGPTAVGKTEISIQLAEALGGEIISADSRLFYRGMDIGTAKPTKEELQRVRHHLINVSNIDQSWSLAVFQEKVTQLADEIRSRKKIPFLVGGTGQYIRAIIEGWQLPPQEPNFRLRNVIKSYGERIGAEALYEKLKIMDPIAATAIEPRNLRRTIRALEVIFSTGHLFSTQRDRQPIDFQYKLIGLIRDRKDLYQRIDSRIDAMFQSGFISEVETILKNGYKRDLPPLSAIGYKEVIGMLLGEIDLDEAIVLMKRRTRQYVRRQANWFKESDPQIEWFKMEPGVIEKIKSFILAPNGWKND